MAVEEFVQYLSEFENNKKISIAVVDLNAKRRYPVKEFHIVSRDDFINNPFIVILVGKSEELEEFKSGEIGQLEFRT